MNHRYIIFADDDADDLELITGFYKQFDRETTVLEFKDGKEVIKFLDDFAIAPALIVLDLNMPRMNGRETLAHIRTRTLFPYIPVVIFTTSMNKQDEAFCQLYNASWINKPNHVNEVKQVARIIAEFCQQQVR